MTKPLQDVVALVVSRPLGPVDTKQAISLKLEDLGARVTSRLGKEVTHIVFQRLRSSDPQEQLAEESELRSLYDRASKMELPVFFVSPLWVHSCLSEHRRVLERSFMVPQPPNNLFTYSNTPGSGPGQKKPLRRRSFRRKAEDYEVDVTDAVFSSSQLIRGGITNGRETEEVASPIDRVAPAKGGKKRSLTATEALPQDGMAIDQELCMTGTQIAAEMLTGLGNDPSNGAGRTLVAMKADATGKKPKAVRGSTRTPATAKRTRRPISAAELGAAGGTAKKRAQEKGSKSAPQPVVRHGAAPRAASRLKNQAAARPEDKPTSGKTGGQSAETKPENQSGAGAGDSDLAIVGGSKVVQAEKQINRHKGSLVAAKPSDASKRGIGLRDVKSRVEMQMPILRAHQQLTCASPRLAEGPQIPVPQVRRVESPWTGGHLTLGTGPTPTPSLPPQRPKPPRVWSQPRPWDPSSSRKSAAIPSPQDVVPDSDDENVDIARVPESTEPTAHSSAAGTQGCLGLSSVDPAILELAKSAVKRLRGMRMCPEGSEERITHLVLDKERRTLKVLLAIANGARLVDPAWLTSSLEADSWLPSQSFQAKVRFSNAAELARGEIAGGARLLDGCRVYIYAQDQPKKGLPSNMQALKRVTAALGGKVVARRDAELCIVSSLSPCRPEGLPLRCKAVREEWLLDAAEHYRLPSHPEWDL